ncbi:MAG: hypothetical protein CVU44_12310 [Chloroflexi bacterium HGW-Chloroflexi-6]|nr:MAG: hypothetical protein CVU44_12310 [Chloroflexi bacterium HGW-Chloroflexi-6]
MQKFFKYDEIALNKAGQLAPAQIKDIHQATNPTIWLAGGGILIAIVVCFGGLFSMMGADLGGMMGIAQLVVGGSLLFALWRGGRLFLLRMNLQKGPIQSAEGEITFQPESMTDPARYIATTNDGKKLHTIGLAGVGVFLPEGRYRFFYLNAQNWFLSAEPLSSEAEIKQNLTNRLLETLGLDQDALLRARQMAQSGQATVHEGPVTFRTSEERDYSYPDPNSPLAVNHTYHCKVGNFEFQLSSNAIAAILPELPYRLYTAPDLLVMEPA